MIFDQYLAVSQQEAQLSQTECMMCCVSKFVPHSRDVGVRKVYNRKSDLQGHSRSLVWYHSIVHIPYPISIPLQLCLYLVRNFITYFPKLKRSRDSEYIPFVGKVQCQINYGAPALTMAHLHQGPLG